MTIERLLEAGRALDAGRLEQAERIYRQVSDADPRSSIAIVGLARVAQRRGDAATAARLAEAALAVDPGNVAAQRLLGEPTSEAPQRRAPALAGAMSVVLPRPPSSDDSESGDQDWPWPALDEQLARYRRPGPGRLDRLLKRG
jgi:hypothetical protein